MFAHGLFQVIHLCQEYRRSVHISLHSYQFDIILEDFSYILYFIYWIITCYYHLFWYSSLTWLVRAYFKLASLRVLIIQLLNTLITFWNKVFQAHLLSLPQLWKQPFL